VQFPLHTQILLFLKKIQIILTEIGKTDKQGKTLRSNLFNNSLPEELR